MRLPLLPQMLMAPRQCQPCPLPPVAMLAALVHLQPQQTVCSDLPLSRHRSSRSTYNQAAERGGPQEMLMWQQEKRQMMGKRQTARCGGLTALWSSYGQRCPLTRCSCSTQGRYAFTYVDMRHLTT